MSLDGFIAGTDHAMDWVFEYEAPQVTWEVMRMTGAMLAGRHTYDVGVRDAGKPSGAAYGGAWSGPAFVLTHRPPSVADPSIVFLSGDIRDAVATARDAAGAKNVEVLGANVARQCIEAKLIDEINVQIAPILLGGGVRMFEHINVDPVRLERVYVDQSTQVTALRFRVRK
jgi:dihydrofolate reductase